MPNLQEFSVLCTTSCTNEVFSSIPNLKSLIVRDHVGNGLIDMSSLRKLEAVEFGKSFVPHRWEKKEALKCFKGIWPKYLTRFVFPTSLKRLTLAGKFRFPWEYISTLVMLPNLEELKLKYYAVWDKVWRLSGEDKFQSLKLFLFSEIYFQHWEASSDSFPNLKRLVLKNCFHLEDLPIDFAEICNLESIQLHNCGILAADCARKIEQEQEDMGNNSLKVHIFYTHGK
ncbi:putative late blight resistance protein homolog R1A-3 [Nicotiana tabacum]|uniref:Late blight resistance protein homolog R1A-3 n=1 Tax=Nicotiana tabacum TaxID=4097 RepID=A0AC58SU16_TOBAC